MISRAWRVELGKSYPCTLVSWIQRDEWQPLSGFWLHFWKVSRNFQGQRTCVSFMLWLTKSLRRNLAWIWGQGVEAGNELAEGVKVFLLILVLLSRERLCFESWLYFQAKPWWFTCAISVEEHGGISSQFWLFILTGAAMSACFSQTFSTNLQTCCLKRHTYQTVDKTITVVCTAKGEDLQ